MTEEERMDKNYFKKQSVAEADSQVGYCRSRTMIERLISAYHLSLRVYGYDPADPPAMDKAYFVKRSSHEKKATI